MVRLSVVQSAHYDEGGEGCPTRLGPDALAKANDIVYGLAAGIQTNDLKRAHKLARRLKAGSVWINTYHRIETSCPFGGYKMSGYGRENGVGMVNYLTRTKSVAVDLNDFVMDLFA